MDSGVDRDVGRNWEETQGGRNEDRPSVWMLRSIPPFPLYHGGQAERWGFLGTELTKRADWGFRRSLLAAVGFCRVQGHETLRKGVANMITGRNHPAGIIDFSSQQETSLLTTQAKGAAVLGKMKFPSFGSPECPNFSFI